MWFTDSEIARFFSVDERPKREKTGHIRQHKVHPADYRSHHTNESSSSYLGQGYSSHIDETFWRKGVYL